MSVTSIEWTDRTWNPVRGCSMAKGSETGGCLNCYAAMFASRFGEVPGHPFEGYARKTSSGPRWTGRVRLIPEKLDEPLRWRKPQRVFVNSMSDLFHESLSDEAIDQVFGVMAIARDQTFQVLTKRADRARRYLCSARERVIAAGREHAEGQRRRGVNGAKHWPANDPNGVWPLLNVWLGVSVEDQATADERGELLLHVPAAIRFISLEPALEEVDLHLGRDTLDRWSAAPPIDWVIVGGESGPGARPFNLEWARSVKRQCWAAGVACFVKQLGRRPFDGYSFDTARPTQRYLRLRNRKGGDPSEWPEDLRVREFPTTKGAA